MISCIEWVPKGAADPSPKRYEMSPAELAMLQEQAELEANLKEEGDNTDDDSNCGSEKGGFKKIDPSSLPADLRMDEYSSDEDEAQIGNLLIGKSSEILGTRTGEDGLLVNDSDDEKDEVESFPLEDGNDSDDSSDDDDDDDDLPPLEDSREYTPIDVEGLQAMGLEHSKNGPMYFADEDDDENSEKEDTDLSPDDALIVIAKTEEDFPTLEVHVYEPNSGNLFVHHDIPLPSFPLCLAHGDINNDGGAGNYCAVGTFSPGIEVWNLDVLDALEPTCILGGEDTSMADELMRANMARAATGKKMKKKVRQQQPCLKPMSHTDAVLTLNWNKVHRQIIASGSADCTVKLWDITQAGNSKDGAPSATFAHHKDKVNAVVWHPSEGTLLATGSFDQTVALVDARSNDGTTKEASLPADCEAIAWDPHNQHLLTAASEDGTVICWDVRKFGEPYWSFVAHEFGGVSDLSYNSHVPGLLATCAIDKTVALWDVLNITSLPNQKPYQCGSKEMNVGKLFSVAFYPSSPWLVGCGGSGNELSLWDISREDPIRARFSDRVTVSKDVESSMVENDSPSGEKENDFEAMMSSNDLVMNKTRQEIKTKRKNNKKKKKKVHKVGS